MGELIDEKGRRRPEFRGGVAVRLYDGQDWTLAKPRVGFTINDGDDFTVYAEADDPRYQEEYDAYFSTDDSERRVLAMVRMSAMLLRSNYTLTNREIAAIVRLQWAAEGDPEAYRILQELEPICLGRGKGRSPDSPASSPSGTTSSISPPPASSS